MNFLSKIATSIFKPKPANMGVATAEKIEHEKNQQPLVFPTKLAIKVNRILTIGDMHHDI